MCCDCRDWWASPGQSLTSVHVKWLRSIQVRELVQGGTVSLSWNEELEPMSPSSNSVPFLLHNTTLSVS